MTEMACLIDQLAFTRVSEWQTTIGKAFLVAYSPRVSDFDAILGRTDRQSGSSLHLLRYVFSLRSRKDYLPSLSSDWHSRSRTRKRPLGKRLGLYS